MGITPHIGQRNDWEQARGRQSDRADTLHSHSFIHCSRPEEVIRVANAFFRRQEGLVRMCIDTAKVDANGVQETDVWLRRDHV